MSEAQVWVTDDDRSIRWVLERALSQAGMTVTVFENGAEAMARLSSEQPHVVVSDIRMPEMDGLSLLENISARHPQLPVIIMTAFSDLESTVSAYQGGAFDYLPKPFDVDEAVALVRRALGGHAQATEWSAPAQDTAGAVGGIVGSAPAMQEVFRAIGRLSRSNITVLITGESGTGKELVARLIHDSGPRADGPFVPVNCGAIPAELMESEFFGHRKGSFTGAINDKAGLLQCAQDGTLFLDEIADLPLSMQVKLLRVIQEQTVRPVGAEREETVNVRILSATHQNLSEQVRQGEFREDLYYRINVIELNVPSLRDRGDDVLILARSILEKMGNSLQNLTGEARTTLLNYQFPGNVRELENMLERAVTLCPSGAIHSRDLYLQSEAGSGSGAARSNANLGGQIEDVEREAIVSALETTRYNKTAAAKLLGLTFRQLRYRIKKLGIE